MTTQTTIQTVPVELTVDENGQIIRAHTEGCSINWANGADMDDVESWLNKDGLTLTDADAGQWLQSDGLQGLALSARPMDDDDIPADIKREQAEHEAWMRSELEDILYRFEKLLHDSYATELKFLPAMRLAFIAGEGVLKRGADCTAVEIQTIVRDAQFVAQQLGDSVIRQGYDLAGFDL